MGSGCHSQKSVQIGNLRCIRESLSCLWFVRAHGRATLRVDGRMCVSAVHAQCTWTQPCESAMNMVSCLVVFGLYALMDEQHCVLMAACVCPQFMLNGHGHSPVNVR